MERNALKQLIEWNQAKRRKPLIVWGARQVGKTYLIKDIFTETCYKNRTIYIDCKIEDEIRAFCNRSADAKKSLNLYRCSKENK